jgi:hypothetical protein
MLSNRVLQRISFAMTLVCFFCLIPCRWDPALARPLSRTRSRLKIWHHNLLVFGITAVIAYFGFCFLVIDLWFGCLTTDSGSEAFVLLGMYFWCGALVVALAQLAHWQTDELVTVINSLYHVDRLVKDGDRFPAPVRVLEPVSRTQTQIVLRFSNFIEPASLIHTFCIVILFREPFDPFRRYFYNVAVWLLPPLDHVAFQAVTVLGYVAFIRLAYGFIVFWGFWFAMVTQCLHSWARLLQQLQLQEPENRDRLPAQFELNLYRILLVLYRMIFGTALSSYAFPLIIANSFLPIVLGFYGTMVMFGRINWGTYALLPSASLALLLFTRRFWSEMARTQLLMEAVLRGWMVRARNRKSPELARYFRACESHRAKLANLFPFTHGSFAVFCEQVLDKTISFKAPPRKSELSESPKCSGGAWGRFLDFLVPVCSSSSLKMSNFRFSSSLFPSRAGSAPSSSSALLLFPRNPSSAYTIPLVVTP